MLQFTERVATLVMNGHPPDKVEMLVLGGTWTSYPHAYQEDFCRANPSPNPNPNPNPHPHPNPNPNPNAYQEEFCRDLFYAANTFGARRDQLRPRRSLEEEQAPTLILALALALTLIVALVLTPTLTLTPTLPLS